MAGVPAAAHSAKIRLAAAILYAAEWEADETADELDFSNFESMGFRVRIPGLRSLRMTISGWVDISAPASGAPLSFASGQTIADVAAYYQGATGAAWTMALALCTNLRETARVEDLIRYTGTLLSVGPYSLPGAGV